MLYGVFSDVHSNLEALSVVLGFLEKKGAEAYICCGDIVGYGADPDECVDRVRGLPNLSAVCGNHDLSSIGRMDETWFHSHARAAVLWTRGRLTASSRSFLESLPTALELAEFSVFHGTPRNPAEEYLLTLTQFLDNIELVKSWPIFVGHSHLPLCFRASEKTLIGVELVDIKSGEEVVLEKNGQAFHPIALNPGSVGQPRDRDWRASCAVYDSERGAFKVFRLEYDKAAAQKKIRAAGLPEPLALRLDSGQ